jgi:hypothetical protein
MTAHELAKLLLLGPDEEVAIWEYMGGDDELREIMSINSESEDNQGKVVLLTYLN